MQQNTEQYLACSFLNPQWEYIETAPQSPLLRTLKISYFDNPMIDYMIVICYIYSWSCWHILPLVLVFDYRAIS